MSLMFKPGDDMPWAGVARVAGVTDYTGYTAHAAIKARDSGSGEPVGTALAQTEAVPLDATGAFEILIPKEVTAEWAVGAVLLIDVVITSPTGIVATTGTGEFETAQRVTPVVPPVVP